MIKSPLSSDKGRIFLQIGVEILEDILYNRKDSGVEVPTLKQWECILKDENSNKSRNVYARARNGTP